MGCRLPRMLIRSIALVSFPRKIRIWSTKEQVQALQWCWATWKKPLWIRHPLEFSSCKPQHKRSIFFLPSHQFARLHSKSSSHPDLSGATAHSLTLPTPVVPDLDFWEGSSWISALYFMLSLQVICYWKKYGLQIKGQRSLLFYRAFLTRGALTYKWLTN